MKTPVFDIGDTLMPSKKLQNRLIREKVPGAPEFPLNDLRIYNVSDVASWLEENDLEADAEEIVEDYKKREEEFMRENNVFEFLRKCSSELGRIGFISDNSIKGKEFMIHLLEKENVPFQGFVVSEEVGVEKPDEKIFQAFLDQREKEAERFVYFGNNVPRDRAAEEAGMDFVWVRQYDTFDSSFNGDPINELSFEAVRRAVKE